MESLERLASSIAQTELLVAALKRENRELAARLAASVSERHAEGADLRGRLEDLERRLTEAEAAPRRDPGLEVRAYDAEHRAEGAERSLNEAQEAHRLERSRLETLIRQLEAQVMASHGAELLPTASAEALEEAQTREKAAQDALNEARNRAFILETQAKNLQTRLDSLLDAERRSTDGTLALRDALDALRRRGESLEQGLAARDREAAELRAQLQAASEARAGRERELEALRAGLDGSAGARAESERELKGLRDALEDAVRLRADKEREAEALRLELEAAAGARAEAERELKSLRAGSADLERIQAERAELRRQKREAQAFARERQGLRRRLEELLATLESVRL